MSGLSQKREVIQRFLRDEVVPVSDFLKFKNIHRGRVQFPLNDKAPDCWLTIAKGETFGIEVTIERGTEKHHLAEELNNTGEGRGFIGLQDDSPKQEFQMRMSKPRMMFTTAQALESTKMGILRSLSEKSGPKYKGILYLLIQSHLAILPKERWEVIKSELSKQASSLEFQEIYVIGDSHEEPWGFQIK